MQVPVVLVSKTATKVFSGTHPLPPIVPISTPPLSSSPSTHTPRLKLESSERNIGTSSCGLPASVTKFQPPFNKNPAKSGQMGVGLPDAKIGSKHICWNVSQARDSVIPASATLYQQISDDSREASDMGAGISPWQWTIQETRHSAQHTQSETLWNVTINRITRLRTSGHPGYANIRRPILPVEANNCVVAPVEGHKFNPNPKKGRSLCCIQISSWFRGLQFNEGETRRERKDIEYSGSGCVVMEREIQSGT